MHRYNKLFSTFSKITNYSNNVYLCQALPYINGALNNFLTNHVINEEAKRTNFSYVIEQYSKYKTGEIR